MKLSIVTICLNDEQRIQRTIESVLKQNCNDIEYIIKDGLSDDHTSIIINQYREEFYSKKIPYRYVNRKDDGIYDAMNQALPYCRGNWVLFLNAGDVFFDKNVCVDFILHEERLKYADVIYGHTLINLNNMYKFVCVHTHENIKYRFDMGHQSTFVKTDVMKKEMFDSKYKIAGDWDFFLRLFNDGYCFKRINMIVSEFKRDGISAQKTNLQFREGYQIRYGKLDMAYYIGLFINTVKRVAVRIFPKYERYRFCCNYMRRCRGDF